MSEATPTKPSYASTLVLVAVCGLLLLGVYWLSQQGPAAAAPPQVAIRVQVADLSQPGARTDLHALHERLASDRSLFVSSPSSFRVLIPSKPGGLAEAPGMGKLSFSLTTRPFGNLTPEQYEAAKKGFGQGGYLVPRVVASTGQAVLFRVSPRGAATFPAGTRERIEGIVQEFGARFQGIQVYSEALGLVDPGARAAIDADFGVHLLLLELHTAEQGGFWIAERLMAVDDAVKQVKDPSVRCVVTPSAFLYHADRAQGGPGQAAPLDQERVDRLGLLRNVAPGSIPTSPDGTGCFVEVYTSASGPAYAALAKRFASRLEQVRGIQVGPQAPSAQQPNAQVGPQAPSAQQPNAQAPGGQDPATPPGGDGPPGPMGPEHPGEGSGTSGAPDRPS